MYGIILTPKAIDDIIQTRCRTSAKNKNGVLRMSVCPDCKRKVVGYGNEYCQYCGAKLDASSNTENGAQAVQAAQTVHSDFEITPKFILIVIGMFIIIGFVVVKIGVGLGDSMREKKCIDIVSSGCLVAYPDIKLDKAFNAYFDDGGWIYTTSDGVDYVTYAGTKNGKSKEIKIQFKVDLDKESFTLEYAGTGEDVYDYEMWDTMDTIMESYYKTGS